MRCCAKRIPATLGPLRGCAVSICAGLVLLAVGIQLAIPTVHLLHDHVATAHQHADAHHEHEHHDHDTDHDRSSCPTCQLFASLRSFAPATFASAIHGIDTVDAESSLIHVAPLIERYRLTPASPRAPPLA